MSGWNLHDPDIRPLMWVDFLITLGSLPMALSLLRRDNLDGPVDQLAHVASDSLIGAPKKRRDALLSIDGVADAGDDKSNTTIGEENGARYKQGDPRG